MFCAALSQSTVREKNFHNPEMQQGGIPACAPNWGMGGVH